jgi:predicted phage terminase large subunit-like protein
MLSDEDLAQVLARPADALDALDRMDCEESLLAFTHRMWPVLEPGRHLVDGWPLEAICEHLEAVTYGQIQKLLINVPPGFMKSLLTDVLWPAWEWGPRKMPSLRYVAFSYSADLTQRDNRRFRDVMLSRDYSRLFGDGLALTKTGEQLVQNDKTGWKLASSVGGVGTGERGDRVILDDPHNVKESESDTVRQETVRWFRESMSSRLNDVTKSAVTVIMQRVHEEDVSGVILSEMRHEYEHLLIPMEWEGSRTISTVAQMHWNEDPRTHVGELAWPERFPAKEVRNLKIALGPYATAGQLQQSPTPRGGGIFKRDWWQLWGNPDDPDDARFKRFPACEFVVASLDGAFGQKQENDYTALTIWGVFRDATVVDPKAGFTRRVQGMQGRPKIILMHAWKKRLPLQGPPSPDQEPGETASQYRQRCMPLWGIVEWVMDSCNRFKVDRLLIEAKANGVDVANQIQILNAGESWGTQLIDPGRLDKTSRAYAVQHLLADSMIYAPDREWADDVITEMSVFPKTAHDDFTDSAAMAWKFLRDIGLAAHGHEIERDFAEQLAYKPAVTRALYPV